MVEMRKDSIWIVFVKKVFLVDFWGPLLDPSWRDRFWALPCLCLIEGQFHDLPEGTIF